MVFVSRVLFHWIYLTTGVRDYLAAATTPSTIWTTSRTLHRVETGDLGTRRYEKNGRNARVAEAIKADTVPYTRALRVSVASLTLIQLQHLSLRRPLPRCLDLRHPHRVPTAECDTHSTEMCVLQHTTTTLRPVPTFRAETTSMRQCKFPMRYRTLNLIWMQLQGPHRAQHLLQRVHLAMVWSPRLHPRIYPGSPGGGAQTGSSGQELLQQKLRLKLTCPDPQV